eukprot:GILK01001125.1.p1 GENE.GILK01001125.1~~GILK01001125.1.p1  ORF type:complete len:514 (-),score=88.66 GILK01001125.1:119-1618(-)
MSFLLASRAVRHFSTRRATGKSLTYDNINHLVKQADYAVRGEVVIKAMEHAKTLRSGSHSLPFRELIFCNIGNPQELGQQPITFNRQVLSLCAYPDLLRASLPGSVFERDAIDRAKEFLRRVPSGIGAYSASQGLEVVRENVAKFIARRDGFPSNPDDIFISDGASASVDLSLRVMIRDEFDGIMVPIPQYPLYSASISLCGGTRVSYYLDEAKNWGLSTTELYRSLKEARAKGVNSRALVIINPGNPTGQCLDKENMREIVQFCAEENLVLLADEVYQENIYKPNSQFHSFKKVAWEMGSPYQNLELISFHSVSKGFLGECGLRGGYMEICGIDDRVRAEMYKLASISLCSNIQGQLMVDLMVNPPKEGEASYSRYAAERDEILQSLKRRALILADGLNKLEGVRCNPVEGAMYAFPSITLPPKAIAAAKAANKQPDTFYVLQLLNETGVVVVPGSGFGQVEGTWHFRTTILPPEDKMQAVIQRMTQFHKQFMDKYRS